MITKNTPRDEVLVFAKYPDPGTVKTRLAADVGDAEAARIYRRLAETVIAGTVCDAYDTRIMYAPRGARQRFTAWLGGSRVTFGLQQGAGLGDRLLHAACRAAARGARSMALIGTDCPFVNRTVLHDAFERLRSCDVVLGPAEDGGYYLLAFNRVHPDLFRGIDWSTDQVYAQTMARITAAGLRAATLPTLFDVDTVAELTRWERMQ